MPLNVSAWSGWVCQTESANRNERLSECCKMTDVSNNLCWGSPTDRLLVPMSMLKCRNKGEPGALHRVHSALTVDLGESAKP